MKQLLAAKPLFLAALCVSISGCLYDSNNSPTTAANQPSSQTAQRLAGTNTNEAGTTGAPETVRTAGGGSLGGYIEQFMDANDKSKLARALDGSLGKSIAWKNPVSGATFAVTPVRKIAMGSNICREYSLSMNKAGMNDKVNGTACIGDDGLWHPAG